MSSAWMCPLAMAASVPVMQPLSSSTTMQQRTVRLTFAPPVDSRFQVLHRRETRGDAALHVAASPGPIFSRLLRRRETDRATTPRLPARYPCD